MFLWDIALLGHDGHMIFDLDTHHALIIHFVLEKMV